MRTFRCTDDISTTDGLPCDCWYREVAPGQWEYRYAGKTNPWFGTDSRWQLIAATSVAQIEAYGHHLEEVVDGE